MTTPSEKETKIAGRSNGWWFLLACSGEALLLVVAWLITHVTGDPLWADFHGSVADAWIGIAAAIPLFTLFLWMLRSSLDPLAGIRRVLDEALRPVLGGWSVLRLAVIALLAGVCEEVLFRSAIQAGLAAWIGPWPALLVASALFGFAHRVTRAYALLAGILGLYLGWLWMQTGNLLVPIVTHAVYDFAALVYFLKGTNAEPPRALED